MGIFIHWTGLDYWTELFSFLDKFPCLYLEWTLHFLFNEQEAGSYALLDFLSLVVCGWMILMIIVGCIKLLQVPSNQVNVERAAGTWFHAMIVGELGGHKKESWRIIKIIKLQCICTNTCWQISDSWLTPVTVNRTALQHKKVFLTQVLACKKHCPNFMFDLENRA